MKLQRKELIENLKKVMPGLDASDGKGLLGADAFVFGESGIHSYNDFISISIPIKTGLLGAVKAKEFFAILQKLKTDELTVVQKESQIIIKAGRSKVTINLVDSSVLDFLQNLHLEELKWKKLGKNFLDGLKLCKINCSNSPLRGVFVNKDIMTATDEMRINTFQLDTKLETFWMDDPAVSELLGLGSTIEKIAFSEGWIHFKGGNGEIFSAKRKNDEEYPFKDIMTWKKQNEKKDGDLEGKFPGDFKEIVERVSVFSEEVNGFSVISIEISPEKLILRAKRQIGSIEEKISWEKKLAIKESFFVKVDEGFLKEAADRSLSFYITKAKKIQSLVFTSDNFMQIIATVSE